MAAFPSVKADVIQMSTDKFNAHAEAIKSLTLAEFFDPESARAAGFFDELVEPGELMARAETLAKQFQELDMHAHKASKRQERNALIRRIRRNLPLDLFSAALQGIRRSRKT